MNLDREILLELRGMRADMKEWMKADVDNHYKKDQKVSTLLERVIDLLNMLVSLIKSGGVSRVRA